MREPDPEDGDLRLAVERSIMDRRHRTADEGEEAGPSGMACQPYTAYSIPSPPPSVGRLLYVVSKGACI